MTAAAKPIVWTIAGSDSGGGAGIQADIQALHRLGCHPCTVITSVTAQNSHAVMRVEPVSDAMLAAQLAALSGDLPPAAIKIGLLATANQVGIIANCIAALRRDNPQLAVVYDPVAVAASGRRLAEAVLTLADLAPLLAQVTLLTPNLPEAEHLVGRKLPDGAAQRQAATELRARGCANVLIKGGHNPLLPAQCVDLLFGADRELALTQPRLATEQGHGSGCTLASAISAALALGYPMADAVVIANAYVHRGLALAQAVGAGPGPVAHGDWPDDAVWFPRLVPPGSTLGDALALRATSPDYRHAAGFAACDTAKLGLYPVVDSLAWIEKLLAEGVSTLQLRLKHRSPEQVRDAIATAVALARSQGARLFINDHWRFAIEAGAYGVHLGQEDLDTADLAAIQRAGLRLGISTHGYAELLRALAHRPSYVAIGAIFATRTKQMPTAPQGLVKLARYLRLTGDTPTVAIGGISCERASAVARTGVGSIAAVTGITEAADYRAAVRAYQAALAAAHA